jgi:hypothetical protein
MTESAKAHKHIEAELFYAKKITDPMCDTKDSLMMHAGYCEGFDSGYEFARKEMEDKIKPMFATPEEYFATFNQPLPEGE